MRTRPKLAGAILAAGLLALGVWWLNHGGGVGDVSLAPTNSAAASADAGGLSELPAQVRTAAGPPLAQNLVAASLATLTLTGRVVNERGLPIEGSKVACCSLVWIAEGASSVDGFYSAE